MRINWYKFLVNKGKGYPIKKKSFAYVGVPFRNVGWVRKVDAVDLSKYDETAFVGRDIPEETYNMDIDCPPGLYLVHAPLMTEGKSSMLLAINTYLFRVTEDAIVCEVDCIHFDIEDWLLAVRQRAAELLQYETSPLDQYSTAELEAALNKRKCGAER